MRYSSRAWRTDTIFGSHVERWCGDTDFSSFAKEEFMETSLTAGGNCFKVLKAPLGSGNIGSSRCKRCLEWRQILFFSFCTDVLLGLAAMAARGLDEDPRLLVFWDGPPGGEGGTGELVKKWQKNFNEPESIDAKKVHRIGT